STRDQAAPVTGRGRYMSPEGSPGSSRTKALSYWKLSMVRKWARRGWTTLHAGAERMRHEGRGKPPTSRAPDLHPARSAQLAVLAAAAVVAAERGLLAVRRFLAGDAQAHARHGLAARLRNRCVALLAMRTAGTLRQPAARPLDPVLDGGVDLFLHRAVAGPTGGHGPAPDLLPVPRIPLPWVTGPATGDARGWRALGALPGRRRISVRSA